jgi:predicted nuclease of predicted toxin-antitoxin system
MTLHFYFDECGDEEVARALIALGIDVKTATMARRKGLSDQEQTSFAHEENRAIYTVDPDFLRLAADLPFPGFSNQTSNNRCPRIAGWGLQSGRHA